MSEIVIRLQRSKDGGLTWEDCEAERPSPIREALQELAEALEKLTKAVTPGLGLENMRTLEGRNQWYEMISPLRERAREALDRAKPFLKEKVS